MSFHQHQSLSISGAESGTSLDYNFDPALTEAWPKEDLHSWTDSHALLNDVDLDSVTLPEFFTHPTGIEAAALDAIPDFDFPTDDGPPTFTPTSLSNTSTDTSLIATIPSPSHTSSSSTTLRASATTPRSISDWVPEDVYQIGRLDELGNWRCSFPGCRSRAVFERACDLRKHYTSHSRIFFCQRRECPASIIGFALQKDYRRHVRSHDQPNVKCQAPNCHRVFSRVDNMRNHYARMHERRQNTLFPRPCRNRRRKSSTTPNS